MTDAFIFYTGLFCFGLIAVAFVLTILEFRKMSSRRARERGSAWASGEKALATASSGGRGKR